MIGERFVDLLSLRAVPFKIVGWGRDVDFQIIGGEGPRKKSNIWGRVRKKINEGSGVFSGFFFCIVQCTKLGGGGQKK